MKVSAIIPAYNAEPWIEEAITSIQTQSMPVHELIVVDDRSTDRTAELARSLGADVVQIAVNSGDGVARNAGLYRATGDVIAWLDADDYWAPHHVDVLTGLLDRHPQASVACAAVQRFGLRTGVTIGYAPVGEPANIFWQAAKDWLHPIIGAMMRREALLDIGGFAIDPRSSVDYDMWLRVSRRHDFIATREVTSFWRWHPKQQSSNYGLQLNAVYAFRRRYLDRELKDGYPQDAQRFVGIMRQMWKKDFDTGLRAGDLLLCTAVFEAQGFVPDLDPAVVQECRAALQRLRLVG
jgi:glycosyltransferase involved in cell wall biosynthesis